MYSKKIKQRDDKTKPQKMSIPIRAGCWRCLKTELCLGQWFPDGSIRYICESCNKAGWNMVDRGKELVRSDSGWEIVSLPAIGAAK